MVGFGLRNAPLTAGDREKYIEQLASERFAVDALRDYYDDFNETDFDEIGGAMRAGITCIRESLERLESGTVVVLSIG
jgi:hypothetical protein